MREISSPIPRWLLFVWLAAAPLTLLSCGYTTQSTLPGNIKTIYVEPFKNKIDYTRDDKRNVYFPLLEVEVRKAVIDRFLFNGYLDIAEPASADLILRGELASYDRSALRFTDSDDVQEYRVQVAVDLELWDATKQEISWQEKGFTGEATYFVSGPGAISEQEALNKAVEDLGRRIVERTLEDW